MKLSISWHTILVIFLNFHRNFERFYSLLRGEIEEILHFVLLQPVCRKHADLCGINGKVLEALQMYHNLMKEAPSPYQYKSLGGYTTGASMAMPPQGSIPSAQVTHLC